MALSEAERALGVLLLNELIHIRAEKHAQGYPLEPLDLRHFWGYR